MQDEILQPEPGQNAEPTSPSSGERLPVNQVIKPSRRAIAGAVVLYVLQALLLAVGLFVAAEFSWPLDPDFYIMVIPVAITTWVGFLGVYHFADFLIFRRYRGELHFDGATVVSKVVDSSPQSFTQREVLAYFPHRNEVLLFDGRTIPLPVCVTHLYCHDPAMATPWLNAWWPEVDLARAIRIAEKAQGWIRHIPNAVKAIILTVVFCCYLQLFPFASEIMLSSLFLLLFFPDWIENRLRRSVMIAFQSNQGTGSGLAQEDHSGASPSEPAQHDRP